MLDNIDNFTVLCKLKFTDYLTLIIISDTELE